MKWVGEKNLKIYKEEFEDHFLKRTKAEYRVKAITWSTQHNDRDYFGLVLATFRYEEESADYMLQSETKPKLFKCIEMELVTKNLDVFLDTYCI